MSNLTSAQGAEQACLRRAGLPMNESRRRFLVRSGLVAAFCGGNGAFDFVTSALADVTEPKDFPQPCAVNSWKKEGVVVRPDQPWEQNHIEAFMSSVEPLDGGRWRIWYGANVPDKPIGIAVAEGVPGEKMVKHRAILSEGEPEDAPLAIGNLPKGWNLAIPTHLRLRDGRHRLYFFAYGRQGKRAVQRYLAADSDDGRRYRVLDPLRPSLYTFWDNTDNKQFLPGQKLEDIVTNDTATVYQMPDGSFEVFAQSLEKIDEKDPRYVAHDNLKGWVRFIDRFTSDDGVRFDQRQRKVLVPDKEDPEDTQFYELTVTHTPRGRVGLLGWYRVRAGYMELQYTFSKDGIHWKRTRRPWIERGKPGEHDSVTIYPPSSVGHHQGKWWLFYTAVNYTHSTLKTARSDEKPCSCIMLATTPSLWNA